MLTFPPLFVLHGAERKGKRKKKKALSNSCSSYYHGDNDEYNDETEPKDREIAGVANGYITPVMYVQNEITF